MQCLNLCHKSRVGTHPVVLPVSPYQAPVQPHIHCLLRRNHLDLRPEKIRFRKTIFFMKKLHCHQLYRLLYILILKRKRTNNNIQLLPFKSFCQLSLILFCRQMGKQIADAKYRIPRFFSNG